jgi:5-amino-6-(5-phosphoribosylamino)uracil reductase
MQFSRLLPEPGMLELSELRDALNLPVDAHPDRPYTIANFVESVDGRATVDGRSAPLSDAGDRAMFHTLREKVDAVIAGTGTLRVERYGPLIRDPEARQRRVENGLDPAPLACVVTRSGDVPTDIPLFADEQSRIAVFTAAPAPALPEHVEVVELDPAEPTLTTALRRLRTQHGVRRLLCEGGPTLFAALLQEGLIDELFVTIAPKLAGGGRGPTITSGAALAEPAELRIHWLLEREESLFARYEVCPQNP